MLETAPPPLILTKGLSKRYLSGDDWVYPLRGVEFTLYPGQFIVIMGPSGAGKSTLLHILGLLERPDKGSYYLKGRDTSVLNDNEQSVLRASRIGFVFQAYNLIAQCTLMENVAMPFLYHPEPPDNVQEIVLSALEEVGLSERKTHRPHQLSGGEMQRAAIARALVINPFVVLADEPTGNLDAENTGTILELFKKINKQGKSLVVVTHDEEVARAADCVLHIKDGRINESP